VRGGWQELGGGAWGAYLVEGLSGVGLVSGRYVRCLTPQLQVRHHLGYPLGATDRHDLGLLAERFGVGVPPAIQPAAGSHRPTGSPERQQAAKNTHTGTDPENGSNSPTGAGP
jgi:hypothetical protein